MCDGREGTHATTVGIVHEISEVPRFEQFHTSDRSLILTVVRDLDLSGQIFLAICIITAATVAGVPPFSLLRLSRSGEWLCTSLNN